MKCADARTFGESCSRHLAVRILGDCAPATETSLFSARIEWLLGIPWCGQKIRQCQNCAFAAAAGVVVVVVVGSWRVCRREGCIESRLQCAKTRVLSRRSLDNKNNELPFASVSTVSLGKTSGFCTVASLLSRPWQYRNRTKSR